MSSPIPLAPASPVPTPPPAPAPPAPPPAPIAAIAPATQLTTLAQLSDKLASGTDVTELDILQYLPLRIAEADGNLQHALAPELFYKCGDLEQYKQARNWWPADAPGPLACPPLLQLCWGIVQPLQLPLQTFEERLRAAADNVVRWLAENERSPDLPNETAEERRKRLRREAVQRHRKLQAEAKDHRVAEVRQLYDVYLQACNDRKAAIASHNETVAAAKLAWERAKQELGI